ncbi:MupG family TIM beta-alpha barrel fold protein, partial [Vibrio parahaemolyticus]|nr:MupG family TIM beta-alpha barrel fold protein [Vibrio parahaemolyticus]
KQKFQKLIHFAKELGFETILDVAPNIFEQLDISYDDLSFFHETGADGIRLDLGFDGGKEALLSYNPYHLAIEWNMSNDVAYLD